MLIVKILTPLVSTFLCNIVKASRRGPCTFGMFFSSRVFYMYAHVECSVEMGYFMCESGTLPTVSAGGRLMHMSFPVIQYSLMIISL